MNESNATPTELRAHYACMERDNPVSRILALIERHAPRLMKEGGGGLPEDQLWSNGVRVDPKDVAFMNREVERRGACRKVLEEIADELGYHYCTVCRFTRETRRKMGSVRAKPRKFFRPDGTHEIVG